MTLGKAKRAWDQPGVGIEIFIGREIDDKRTGRSSDETRKLRNCYGCRRRHDASSLKKNADAKLRLTPHGVLAYPMSQSEP